MWAVSHATKKIKFIELGRFYKNNNALPISRGFFTGVHVLSPQALDALLNTPGSCLVSEIYLNGLVTKKK